MRKRTSAARGSVLAGAALAALLLGGCRSAVKVHPSGHIGGLDLAALQRSEYTVMDTVEGRGEVTTILFFIKLGKRQWGSLSGGPMVHPRLHHMWGPRRDAVAVATFDAIVKAPGADALLPLSTTVSRSGYGPFYCVETATVRAKAIKIKADR